MHLNNGGVVSVNGLSASSNFQTFTSGTYTSLPASVPGAWTYKLADFNGDRKSDLYAINKNDAGYTSVTILDGADDFTSKLLEIDTTLTQTNYWYWQLDVADFNADGHADIYAINKANEGHTAVFVLDAANYFQAISMATNTPLGVANDPLWQFDVADFNNDLKADLYAIYKDDAGQTAVHVLDAASNFQTWTMHTRTPLGAVHDPGWQLDVGDYNADGRADLYAMYRNDQGRTSVHVLNAASNFQVWTLHTLSALGATTDPNWDLEVSLQGSVAAGPWQGVAGMRGLPKGDWDPMQRLPRRNADMVVHLPYKNYSADETTWGYLHWHEVSKGTSLVNVSTYKLHGGFNGDDWYLVQVEAGLVGRHGNSEDGWMKIAISDTHDPGVPVRVYGASSSDSVTGNTSPNCTAIPVGLAVAYGPVGAGVPIGSVNICDRGASIKLDSSTLSGGSKWTLHNTRKINGVTAYRFINVDHGAKPIFDVDITYPTDKCTRDGNEAFNPGNPNLDYSSLCVDYAGDSRTRSFRIGTVRNLD